MTKRISIAMRARNDVELTRRTVDALMSQNYRDFEVLAFDNASTDGTREILEECPKIKIFDIPEGGYIPGKVLNFAAQKCSGEVVIFNNCDSVPLNRDWLENIAAPLLDGTAAAVYARQTPRPDADPWVVADYARAFSDKPFSDGFFSMVSSGARADVLRDHPFDETVNFSEDVKWANELRAAGLKVEYRPSAMVEHSHNYTREQAKKRFAGEGIADAQMEGSAQSYAHFLKGLAATLARDFVHLLKTGSLAYFPRDAAFRWTQKHSYYAARKAEFERLCK